jgi:hypothetical protein
MIAVEFAQVSGTTIEGCLSILDAVFHHPYFEKHVAACLSFSRLLDGGRNSCRKTWFR